MKGLIKAIAFCLIILPGLGSTLNAQRIRTGADRMEVYLPLLTGKKVAVFANQTSSVGKAHLVDTLLSKGIQIVKIFAPEHGFRGTADAGEHIDNTKDAKTGLAVISLYGAKRKPSAEELQDVDVLLFDIQDVGVRFYTYISSLQEFMEAALENKKPLMILDRPNPNGSYVDGPVLDRKFSSFVGMQPIPVVYGLTIGEYAMMLAGEKWLSEKANLQNSYNITTQPTRDTPFHIQVIKCAGYKHSSEYELPVKPSPNLPNQRSVLLYPSICFFEGTVISLGRGTDKPFQVFGSPGLPDNLYSFTPVSVEGAKNPPLLNQKCFGYDLSGPSFNAKKEIDGKLQLKWLMQAYDLYLDKSKFFIKPTKPDPKPEDYFFNKLAGNDILMQQIIERKTEAEIRRSWEPALSNFKTIRSKYLLYGD